MDRKYDIILLGATGYTGQLCVEYMVKTLPTDLKWAIAGRNKEKLDITSTDLGVEKAGGAVISLDLSSESEIFELAQSTRLLINIIGPYATTCGPAVFKACAENGTHYVDGCGEPIFRRDMIAKYDDVARASGAKMVITCGWGAVPADLSTYLAVYHIRKKFLLPTREVVGTLYDVEGSASGGAIDTVCSQIAEHGLSGIDAASTLDTLSPRKPVGNPAQITSFPLMNVFGVQNIPGLGSLAVHFHEPVDRPLVGRSWGLYASGLDPALPEYGPNFQFFSRLRLPNAFVAWMFRLAFIVFRWLMTLSPIRVIIGKWLFPAGTGASAEKRHKYHFTYRALGVADSATGSIPNVLVEFAYPGDANEFTAMTMTEAALLLLEDDTGALYSSGGVLTPAALGKEYAERLQKQQVRISVDTI